MSTRWRRSYGEPCGSAVDCFIQPGEPLQEIWPRRQVDFPGMNPLLRCATHALGSVPADLVSAADQQQTTTSALPPADPAEKSFVPLRQVNVAKLPFDHKAAAAGRDDE